MDVDSTISSGRSTPAMMNGQGSTTSSSKNIAYNCCWDQCQACFSSSQIWQITSFHTCRWSARRASVCLWKGCEVCNTPAPSRGWSQTHAAARGRQALQAAVGGCSASFVSGSTSSPRTHALQAAELRKGSSQPKAKAESPSKAGINKRRKLRNKRHARYHDRVTSWMHKHWMR